MKHIVSTGISFAMDKSHEKPESAHTKSDRHEPAAERLAQEAAHATPNTNHNAKQQAESHVAQNHAASKHLPGLDLSSDVARTHFADSIEKLFPKIDTNHNGRISLDELAVAIGDKKYAGRDAEALVVLRNLLDDSDPKYAKRGVGVPEVEEARHSAGMKSEVIGYADSAHKALTSDSDLKLYGTVGISKDAVHQGTINDCWALSTIAAVANTHPEWIKNMIKANQDGSYTVTAGDGTILHVTAPTEAERGLSNRGGHAGLWVDVLEKAMGQYMRLHDKHANPKATPLAEVWNGGYGEDALKFFTGYDAREIKMSTVKKEHDGLARTAAFLEEHLSKKVPLVAATVDNPRLEGKGLSGWHVYTILGFERSEHGGGTVIVRNPWGTPKEGPYKDQFRISLKDFRDNFYGIEYPTVSAVKRNADHHR